MPAKTPHQPSFGAQPGAQDAFPSHDDTGEFSAAYLCSKSLMHITRPVDKFIPWQELQRLGNIEVEVRSVEPQTVSQQTQEFSKIWRKVVSMVDTTAAKHGFKAVFIICGKVVNQDASLGYIHETPGAESLMYTTLHPSLWLRTHILMAHQA
ncbi:hypothetical protein F4604DRAFT_1692203 [Suillus subluteus]|nr:hypothetical protein F4604DRAFT_1692203 [Suillus subluteus]